MKRVVIFIKEFNAVSCPGSFWSRMRLPCLLLLPNYLSKFPRGKASYLQFYIVHSFFISRFTFIYFFKYSMVLLNFFFPKRAVLSGKDIELLVILVTLILVQPFSWHFLEQSWNWRTHNNKAMQLTSNMSLIHIFSEVKLFFSLTLVSLGLSCKRRKKNHEIFKIIFKGFFQLF